MRNPDSCAFCPFCGEKLSGGFKFCPKCGRVIPAFADKTAVSEPKADTRTKAQREKDHRKWVHLRRLARKRRRLREEKKQGIRRETILEYVVRSKLKLCFPGLLHFTDPGLMHPTMPKRFMVLSYLYCILAWCVILFSFVAPVWCGIFEPNAKFTLGEWIVIPLASLVVGLLVGAWVRNRADLICCPNIEESRRNLNRMMFYIVPIYIVSSVSTGNVIAIVCGPLFFILFGCVKSFYAGKDCEVWQEAANPRRAC